MYGSSSAAQSADQPPALRVNNRGKARATKHLAIAPRLKSDLQADA